MVGSVANTSRRAVVPARGNEERKIGRSAETLRNCEAKATFSKSAAKSCRPGIPKTSRCTRRSRAEYFKYGSSELLQCCSRAEPVPGLQRSAPTGGGGPAPRANWRGLSDRLPRSQIGRASGRERGCQYV